MRVFILAIAVICALPATAQDADELRIAREVLTRLQDQSFDKKREYCGYIGYDENGRLKASDPIAGTLDGCSAAFLATLRSRLPTIPMAILIKGISTRFPARLIWKATKSSI